MWSKLQADFFGIPSPNSKIFFWNQQELHRPEVCHDGDEGHALGHTEELRGEHGGPVRDVRCREGAGDCAASRRRRHVAGWAEVSCKGVAGAARCYVHFQASQFRIGDRTFIVRICKPSNGDMLCYRMILEHDSWLFACSQGCQYKRSALYNVPSSAGEFPTGNRKEGSTGQH